VPVSAGRQLLLCVLVVGDRNAELLEIIGALSAARGFACGLDGGQQQCHQDSDNRDDDEQLDECKCRSFMVGVSRHKPAPR
jgi:hypothetical protein